MSLIDEALKRARQEASRQEAAEREKRYARVPVYLPPSRRSRPWLLPVVVAVCLAAGVAGGLLLRSPHPATPVPANPPAPTPPVAPETTETKKPLAEKPAEKAVVEKPVIEEQSEPTSPEATAPLPPPKPAPPKLVAEPTPSPVVALPQPAPPPPSPPPSPVVALPQPSPTPAPAPSADIRSYVREVPAGDGTTIRLNGIAFSAQPVALFGDKVVAPGESIGGFTVVAIEAQRVKLQGPGGAVYVTLK
ncbi:MAG TPA: hypothetical protein VH988_03815 [Thermoanaerobaculia bacterium]|jgi:hypothetical protein|nr:hypothetical protein [Thermoanaerobaculia bacterium]